MILYGLQWENEDPVKAEMHMIQCGGYLTHGTTNYGEGLFHHYRELMRLLWPDDDQHRWTDAILEEILNNRITVIGGPRDSGKTHCMSRYGLADYFCFPKNTLTIMTSSHVQGVQLRVFGQVKDFFQRAKERHPWLPGNIVESELGIFTDSLERNGMVRDMRKGIICVACAKGEGENLEGLEKFIGVKQQRRRLLGDEVQFVPPNYLNVMANLDSGDFKGVFCGNFLGTGDPMDILAEPKKGWVSIGEPTKTVTWDNLKGGRTLNLVGMDSPNFDFPKDQPKQYSYLVGWEDVDRVVQRYGDDSLQFWSQIKGVRKANMMAHRILTMEICRKFGAFDEVMWEGTPRTKVLGLDAAYGGDRAVIGHVEFGRDVKGHTILKPHVPQTVKIRISEEETAEIQLAKAIAGYCEAEEIPFENVFFDAGMRATLATEIARIASVNCNAINFGGPATDRPVSQDDFIKDPKTGDRRLKKCNEAYSKFVTELAYSVRMVVECAQMRTIPESVVREFEMREWYKVAGDRIELETKAETKKRMGKSPDEADWMGICVEGARRLGFMIEWTGKPEQVNKEDKDWLERELLRFKTYTKKYELKYG